MSIIIKVWDDPNDKEHQIRTRLPGEYGDGQKLIAGFKKVLAGYPESGYNAEHGYHWARDGEGKLFKFVSANS